MNTEVRKPIIDWLTVAAIAAVVFSLTVAFHEGIHALSCVLTGGDLQEYSAIHVACQTTAVWQDKVIAGSASIANIVVGTLLWLVLLRSEQRPFHLRYLLWLAMLMNWLMGSGYWMFSGIANVGDWATVIEGWQPHWLWRLIMAVIGTPLFMFFVWHALHTFGTFIGGTETKEQIARSQKLGVISYGTAVGVTATAGLFYPYGLTSFSVVAAMIASMGALSPLVWMMQWFRSPKFVKRPGAPLEISRRWEIIGLAILVVFVYAFILGRTLYF